MLTGIDVHGSKGAVDWRKVRDAGQSFCIVKATEGRTFRDARFQTHRREAAQAGLLVGAYHFARPSANTPEQEAMNFLGFAGDGKELLVLDFEDERASGNLAGWARRFLQIVESKSGRRPLLYSYGYYWKAHGSTDPWFARFPLWLADYSPPAMSLAPWGRYTIWQYTSSGSCPGVPGRVDMNRFDGSEQELAVLFHAEAPPAAPAPRAPVYGPIYEETDMQPIDIQVRIDAEGRGYTDLPVDPHKIVSVVFNTANPPDSGYKPSPDWARLNVNGSARIVIEEALPGGLIDATVWVAA